MSVINLSKENVFVDFVVCEKKKNNKNNNKKKKGKKREREGTTTRTTKLISLRSLVVLEIGVVTCASTKEDKAVFVYALRKRWPNKFSRKHYFIDVVIKARRTKADKRGVQVVGAIDPGYDIMSFSTIKRS